ncbi:Lrp/AsnC family transcriptional regulator [Pseudonocardia ailaonensis]|uniref:Lrp/AsnC family transcriptional regulator n=1 Tax=Pseudonocardia ailaonensis TaxID=367279 RepID=UPI0031DCC715
MDETDRAILAALGQEGRLTNVELAERVHLTPGPCLRRVQRLESSGVIEGYRAMISPDALGRGFEVVLEVELARLDRDSVVAFEESMAAFDEVTEFLRLFGAPDYLLRVAVADLPAYETFLMDRVMALPGIQRVNSRFTMKRLKS